MLEEIHEHLITNFDKLTIALRHNYEEQSEDEKDTRSKLFKAARERVSAAVTTLRAHAKHLQAVETDEAIVARLQALTTHFELPSLLGQKIKLTTPTEIDFSDAEESAVEELADEMETVFDLKTAIALVPIYDGSSHKLQQFVSSVELLVQLTPDEQQAMACTFVKTRLVDKAQSVAGHEQTVTAINEKLKTECKTTETSKTLSAKLAALQQSTSASGFAEEVSKLSNALRNIYMAEGVPSKVVTDLANSAGVNALINGCKWRTQ